MGMGKSLLAELQNDLADVTDLPVKRADGSASMPLLGLSFYWAWILSLLILDRSTLPTLHILGSLPVSVSEYAIRGMTLAAIFFLARNKSPRRTIVTAAQVAPWTGLAGVAMLGLGSMLPNEAAPFVTAAAWVPIGIADGLLLIGWLNLYRIVGMRRAVAALCLSALIAVALLLLVSFLYAPAALAVIALLPLACGFSLKGAQIRCSPAEKDALDEIVPLPKRRPASLNRITVAIVLFAVAFGAMQAITFGSRQATAPIWCSAVGLVLGTALAYGASIAPAASRAGIIYRIALPLTACGLLAAPLLGDDLAVANSLVIAGFYLFDLVSITLLIRVSMLDRFPSTSAFSIGRGANAFGIFAGWILGCLLSEAVSFDSAALSAFNSLLLVVLIVSCGSLFAVGDEDGGNVEDGGQTESCRAKSDGSLALEEPTPGRWKRQGDFIAAKYGLSQREKEVFCLLARGRNVEYISTVFVISPHTSKTHIHNVYKKLGIHSQQDLISMVEQAADELKTF